MAFRVLVAGGRGPVDYFRLRDVLDKLLANRMPDVQILTAGGPGVPALAASYARSRGLEVVVINPDHNKHKTDAVERCNSALVDMADAVVVVGEMDWELRKMRARAMAKRIPVRVVGVGDMPETDEGQETSS
jgi:hypothetical protein